MPRDRDPNVGLNERNSQGEFVTVNNVDNPSIVEKYGKDSYYVSYGDEKGHVTRIYDGNGNEVPESDQPKGSRVGD
jgi:hypothetical protein